MNAKPTTVQLCRGLQIQRLRAGLVLGGTLKNPVGMCDYKGYIHVQLKGFSLDWGTIMGNCSIVCTCTCTLCGLFFK